MCHIHVGHLSLLGLEVFLLRGMGFIIVETIRNLNQVTSIVYF